MPDGIITEFDRRPVLQGPDRRTTLRTSVTTADPAVRAKLLKTVQLGRVGKWMRSRIIRCGGKPEYGLPLLAADRLSADAVQHPSRLVAW